MILIGLTGGIGTGKSTVSERLAARGAVIVDADQIARDLQAPGSPVLEEMSERFGGQHRTERRIDTARQPDHDTLDPDLAHFISDEGSQNPAQQRPIERECHR